MTIHDENKLTTADPASIPARDPEQDPRRYMPPGEADAVAVNHGESEALFPHGEVNLLKPKWNAIQARFVDAPRESVEEADQLVASTIKRLAESFAAERAALEAQWAKGDDVSTEDLRQALRRYRSFFDRLLSVQDGP